MAGYKVSDYALGNDKWSNFLTTIEKQRKGFIALSLTNYDNNSLPAIAAGSYVEINGALYGFDSEEAINGTPTSGSTNYIYIDPSDIKPYWTTTAPTWSNNKSGWYDSTEAKRYIGGCYYDGTNYTGKWVYQFLQQVSLDNIPDGTNYVKLNKTTQTIYGNKTFNGSIYDKNGNEVIAMQVETKRTTLSATEETSNSVTVTGFSFNPTGVLNISIASNDPSNPTYTDNFGLGSGSAYNGIAGYIKDITFGTGSVTITFYPKFTTTYNVIVTACRT